MVVEVSPLDPGTASDSDAAEHYGVTMAVKDLDYPGRPAPTLDWVGQPVRAQQLDTAVMAEFRGRGLGLALKGAMLRRLTAERPALKDVFTSTAHDNAHMIGVNHALGFHTDGVIADIEVELAELARRLQAR